MEIKPKTSDKLRDKKYLNLVKQDISHRSAFKKTLIELWYLPFWIKNTNHKKTLSILFYTFNLKSPFKAHMTCPLTKIYYEDLSIFLTFVIIGNI